MSTLTENGPRLDLRPPDDDRPLGGYMALMVTFAGLASLFAVGFRASGRKLPDRVDPGDLVLLTLASHKTARLLAKDRVTSPLRAPFT